LSAAALAFAGVLGWLIGDKDQGGLRRYENAAGLFVGLALLLLIVAVIFWSRYLIFGPIGDWLREALSDNEAHG
jgi:hypothetical protein